MSDNNLINIKTDNSWAYIEIDEVDRITDFNEKTKSYFNNIEIGEKLISVLPWFNAEWLHDADKKRIVKTSLEDRFLLQFVQKDNSCKKILLNNIFEFKDVMQAWCEIGQSLIKLQTLIDSYDDSIMITNGSGIIRAYNKSFLKASGLENVNIINKSIFELEKEGLFPKSAVMDVLKDGEEHDSIVKFINGNEAIMSAKPLFHNGKLIRITTNIRNINDLNLRYEKLSYNIYNNKKNYVKRVKLNEAIEELNLSNYTSKKMASIFEIIEDIADYDIPLLLTGESGTGKTTIAKCIYLCKTNKNGNFVHINCSAIPENLIESELFGYEKGSFTGADKTKKGLFEEANNGVVLLDEIGDMPLSLQSKLLNVLQERKFYRVGGTKPIDTNAQVIAATNKNLKKLVSEGNFREDLFFRLNVIPIEIPSLRDRKEDIPQMIMQIVDEINLKYKSKKIIDNEAITVLKDYDWPGNIRELRNMIERLLLLSKKNLILKKDLPEEVLNSQIKLNNLTNFSDLLGNNLIESGKSFKSIMSDIENVVLDKAIQKYGSIRKAAAELGINESTITRKRKQIK